MEKPIYEIEYKYLVDISQINYQKFPFDYIEQAYISISPVIRIRQKNQAYILTIKGKGTVKHLEYELSISKAEYQNLKPKAEGYIISKKRYYLPYSFQNKEYTIELDVFENEFSGLILAEVEFSSEIEAQNFQPPKWFLQNVSQDQKYYNSYLSKFGWENKQS